MKIFTPPTSKIFRFSPVSGLCEVTREWRKLKLCRGHFYNSKIASCYVQTLCENAMRNPHAPFNVNTKPPCPVQCHRRRAENIFHPMTLNGAWGFGVDIEWGMGVTHHFERGSVQRPVRIRAI